MTNFKELTTDYRIKLKRPMGCFENVGEVCEIVNVDTEDNTLSFKFGDSGLHLGVVSSDELDKYFDVVEPAPIKNDYGWHPFGYMDNIYPVEYQYQKDGLLTMRVLGVGANEELLTHEVNYKSPDIENRKSQNGENKAVYDQDLKITWFKLLSILHTQLYVRLT